jgi:hypothetical protein
MSLQDIYDQVGTIHSMSADVQVAIRDTAAILKKKLAGVTDIMTRLEKEIEAQHPEEGSDLAALLDDIKQYLYS